jgi:hypothetical protein
MLEGGIEVPARDECTEETVDQILAYFQLKAISDRVSQIGKKKKKRDVFDTNADNY